MSVLGGIGNYFKTIGLSLFGQLKVSIASFLHDFVAQDLGKLAYDAVATAEAKMAGAAGAEKLAAAKVQFLTDAKTAGHDVTAFSESVLNFLLEAALQAFLAAAGKGVLAVAG